MKILGKFLKFVLLLGLFFPYLAFGAPEDFSGYTEVDPLSHITVAASWRRAPLKQL